MRKFTLLVASALCIVNLGFAQKQRFDFLKANEVLMKAPTATTALSAPVATEATEVSKGSFIANWNAVAGANVYILQVGRRVKTSNEEVQIRHLYEDFRLTKPGYKADTEEIYLYDVGQTMRDWILLGGETAEYTEFDENENKDVVKGAIKLNSEGELHTPVLDFSCPAKEGSIIFGVKASAQPGDQLEVYYYYSNNGEIETQMAQLFEFGATGSINKGLTFVENFTNKELCFMLRAAAGNKGPVIIKRINCRLTVEANQEIDVVYSSVPTENTSAKIYTAEYLDKSGVVDEYYYSVGAYAVVGNEITDVSDFSNVIIANNSTAIDEIVVSSDKIYVSDNLHVVLDAPAQVSVYNMTGALVGSCQGVEGDNEISLPASGVYVVKAGNKVVKVVK